MVGILHAFVILISILSLSAPYHFRHSQVPRIQENMEASARLIAKIETEFEKDKIRETYLNFKKMKEFWTGRAFLFFDLPYGIFLLWLNWQLSVRLFS